MSEIWSARGLDGVLALLADCDPWTVGRYAAHCLEDRYRVTDVLRTCLSNKDDSSERLDNFMRGFIALIDESVRSTVISTVAETATVDQAVRLYTCAPFNDQTWRLLEHHGRHVRERYWRTVFPEIARFTESETTQIIDRLVEAERPRAAFFAVRFGWDKVETSRLRRLLTAVVNVNTEPADHFAIESYRLSEALDSFDGRPGVTVDEMAQLEFACIQALDRSEHGIPNLESKLAQSPSLFVQALALFCKRSDGGQDPAQWRADDPERRASLGTAAYRLLRRATRIPGTDAEGKVDAQALSQWVTEARRLCTEYGRAAIGDQQIGQLMSKAPSEDDGSWPCQPVCEVLESIASEHIARGFEIGVYNARGVVSRTLGEGGEQERELSARYRAWAQRRAFDYPYVARVLERIAKGYDRDAEREDSQVRVMKRLEH